MAFPLLNVRILSRAALIAVMALAAASRVSAQDASRSPNASAGAGTAAPSAAVPKDYVIGINDILTVVVWPDKDLSAEVVVRPDGKISLPIVNDVPASGLTPEQLAREVEQAATKFVRDPGATVIVKEIHSRNIYVVGEVSKPGTFPLGGDMNVMQAIALAGGFLDGAKKSDVTVVRTENGQAHRYKFNYNDVIRGRRLEQNIRLVPDDMILVR